MGFAVKRVLRRVLTRRSEKWGFRICPERPLVRPTSWEEESIHHLAPVRNPFLFPEKRGPQRKDFCGRSGFLVFCRVL